MNLSFRLTRSIHQIKLPTINVQNYLNKSGSWEKDCKQIANNLKTYGLVIIKDPRVNQQQNNRFLDLMEKYFVKRSKQFQEGNRTIDFSPQSNFQRGIMHAYQQKFQSYKQEKESLKQEHKSLTPTTPSRDPKWRFHWVVNKIDVNVFPKDFPQFSSTMNSWGKHMRQGCLTVAQMTAIGLGLEQNYLSGTIKDGLAMLSPTAVDLQKTKVADVLAAFHRDFDLLTIHGKARYGGLFAWLNTGQKFQVKVPEGHLLLQAGKQLEWLTGGEIKAGFHEVIHTQGVQKAKQQSIKNNRIPWRISSTMFCQIQDSYIMEPHTNFRNQKTIKQYPPISAQEYLKGELYQLTQIP